MEIKVYLANLGKYNEGELVGKWVTLPLSEEELEDVYCDIKLGYRDEDGVYHHGYTEIDNETGYEYHYEELAIHDYEAPFKIDEYDNIERLNELAERLEGLKNYQVEDVERLLETGEVDFEEALDSVEGNGREYCIWDDCNDMSDVAYAYYKETGMMDSIPDHLKNYIDWEGIGRDMEIEGSFYYVGNSTYIEFID